MITTRDLAEHVRLNLTKEQLLSPEMMAILGDGPNDSTKVTNGNGGRKPRKAKAVSDTAKQSKPPKLDDDKTKAVLAAMKEHGAQAISEIAEHSSLTKAQAARSLQKLVSAKEAFMGGERRFARYALSKADAEAASVAAQTKSA